VLADESTGCGEAERGGCYFASNYSMTRSTVLTEAEKTLDQACRCNSDSPLAYRWIIAPTKTMFSTIVTHNLQPGTLNYSYEEYF
jgi:hypothetical protein